MNREIIFRGKREKTGEWVEGYLVKRDEPFLHDIVIPVGNTSQVSYAIIRGTVGQYTGLKDSTGKRIFEGDIVHYKNSIEQAKGIIEWGGCRFYFKWIDITEPNGALYFFQCEKELEIIGNRFDNPELLVTE